MSKTVMRKRLSEASKKCYNVFMEDLSSFNMSTTDARTVRDIGEKLAKIASKLK